LQLTVGDLSGIVFGRSRRSWWRDLRVASAAVAQRPQRKLEAAAGHAIEKLKMVFVVGAGFWWWPIAIKIVRRT